MIRLGEREVIPREGVERYNPEAVLDTVVE
jgi:hypothetical protein